MKKFNWYDLETSKFEKEELILNSPLPYEEPLALLMSGIPEIQYIFIIDIHGNLVAAVEEASYDPDTDIVSYRGFDNLSEKARKICSSLAIPSAVTHLSILDLFNRVNLGVLNLATIAGPKGIILLRQIDSSRFLIAVASHEVKWGLIWLDTKRLVSRLVEIPYTLPKRKSNLKQKLETLEEEIQRGLVLFLGYATMDIERFHIPEIAGTLEQKSEVEQVLYWQAGMPETLSDFTNEHVLKCDIYLLFCSQNSTQAELSGVDWEFAHRNKKFILPIFESIEDVPPLLRRIRGILFKEGDLKETISQIYQEILDIYAIT
ncbi:MAG: roadblock/LC7 domain-containing protein [Candidatus Helarchaeota archaeon]